MGISTSTWGNIVNDATTIVEDIDKALTVGAALGVPEAGVVEPLVAILETVLEKARAAMAGNLNVPGATVATVDATINAELAEDFDPATGLKKP